MSNTHIFISSSDHNVASESLVSLMKSPLPNRGFFRNLEKLQLAFESYCRFCSPPWAAPGLKLTPEIIIQSELWLPLNTIRPIFYHILRSFLSYKPIFSSTPFANASCWFSIVSRFPHWLANYDNPANLLRQIIFNEDFRHRFMFWIFMPQRYYGANSNRYPQQMEILSNWMKKRSKTDPLRCLDAVCGDGTALYAWHEILIKSGFNNQMIHCEGWALDPLECWAAAYKTSGCNQFQYNTKSSAVTVKGRLIFRAVDFLKPKFAMGNKFDLIFCNGLLGGPIVHTSKQMQIVVDFLIKLLSQKGIIVIADHFHDGWRKLVSLEAVQDYFTKAGMVTHPFGEGFCAKKRTSVKSDALYF